MLNTRDRMWAAPRLAMTLVILALLAVSAPAPLVSAEDTEDYTAAEIETWLVDAISGATVTKTAPPSVTLDDTTRRMVIEDLVFEVRGISSGLSYLRLTFDGSTTVDVAGELHVLGELPPGGCTALLACRGAAGKLHFTSVSNVKVADFEPSLSAGDLDTIADVLNQILDTSGLAVTSPGGDLTGLDVIDDGVDKLKATWSGSGTTYYEVAGIQSELNSMADMLAGKATDYLAAGEGNWNVDVVVNPVKLALEIDGSCSAFGVTAALSDFNILFDGLTATVTDATLSVGTSTKTFTFSLEGVVGCDALAPTITMSSLSVGDEYPGFRDFIVDIETALLSAIEQAVDAVVSDTLLEFPFCPESITVEGELVVLHSAGEVTVELALKTGWNMVSVPVVPDDPAVSVVFAGSEAVYTWNPLTKSYVMPTQVEPERGYWVGVISDRTMSVTGTPVTSWSSQLRMGWNMVGSIHGKTVAVADLVDNPPASIQRAAVYIWNPTGKSYATASNVEPGKGYWLGTIQDCTLSIS